MLERLDHFEQFPPQQEVVLVDHPVQPTDASEKQNGPITPLHFPFSSVCLPDRVDDVMDYYGGCGTWMTEKKEDEQRKTNEVLSSERYLSQTLDNGNRADFFMQYHLGYRGQGEGVFNPKSISWSGDNETIRVLKVEWDASNGQVSANYLAAKDMRYAMDDFRRYEENQWRQERLTQVRQELMQMQQGGSETSNLELDVD